MKRLFFIFAVLLSAMPLLAAAERPNVIFILADDLGGHDVGCYGSTFHETPNIDALARRGVKFTNAYAASPLCSPTRASLLTGLYPARIGITAPVCHVPRVQLEKRLVAGRQPDDKAINADSLTRLKSDYFTLPEAMKEAGYATAHFGKWHLGFNQTQDEHFEPKDQGYDFDFPHTPNVAGPGGGYIAPWKFIRDPVITGKPGEHIEDRMSEEAAKYITEHKDAPFFINYWAYSVHSPWNARRDYIEHFKPKADEKNPQHNALYAAMVKSLDDGVGRIVKAVDAAGIADRTIIIFFSDNGGWSYPPKVTDPEGFENVAATSNLPQRSGKASLYEGGTREPCIMVWPGKVKPNTTNERLIQSTDFYPTLLTMCRVKPHADLKFDGVDQTSAILGKAQVRDRVFCHFPHGNTAQAEQIPGFLPGTSVRRGDWKLIRFFADNDDASDRLELYNLKDDVGETKNLAAEKPQLAAELNELISGFLKDAQAVIPVRNPNYGKVESTLADPLAGWKARGCVAEVKDGIVTVTGQNDAPFLGVGAQGSGATTVTLRVRCAHGGDGKIEWLTPPAAGESVPFSLAGGDWQTVTIAVPATAPFGILRVYLPAQKQPVDVDWIEIKGKETKRWEF